MTESTQSQHIMKKDDCWAFDIETLGQLPSKPITTTTTTKKRKITSTNQKIIPPITCVCLYNGTIEHALCFYGVSQNIIDSNLEILVNILDSAQVLIGFNAIHFDLEYIQRFFKLSTTQLNHWIYKTVDPYLFMKTNLGITCSLSTMLAMNHLPSKSASGLKAIVWAKQNRMDLVIDYCMMDTKLTYSLCCGGTNNGPNTTFRINDLWLVNWIYTPPSDFKIKKLQEGSAEHQTYITWFTERQSISLQPSFYITSYSQEEELSMMKNFISTECLTSQGLITTVLT